MKRTIKMLAAVLAAIGVLMLNVPLMPFVAADGNSYTLDYQFESHGWTFNDGIANYTQDQLRQGICIIEPGTITIPNAGSSVPSVEVILDGSNIGTIQPTVNGVEVTKTVRVTDVRTSGNDEELILESVYKVDWSSNVYRAVSFSDANGNINILGDRYYGNISIGDTSSSGSFYLERMPTTLRIEVPGGVGADSLAKLTGVTINGTDYDVQNGYADNTFTFNPSATGDLSIVLTGDSSQAWAMSWYDWNCTTVPAGQENEIIDNGSLRIVDVYTDSQRTTRADGYDSCTARGGNGYVDANGFGNIVIQGGLWMEIELIPRYGAQYSGLTENGITPINGMDIPNHYLFQVPTDHNVHLRPVAVEVEDEVRAGASNAITGGEIHLAENELSGGSGALSVHDDDVSATEEAAILNNYSATGGVGEMTVQDSVSLDLDNVYMKPNSDGDEWAIAHNNLANSAQITLRLNEVLTGVQFNSIVIAHELHDGSIEYLNADYNTDLNTVTFSTSGFSEYTITTVYDPSQPPIDVNPDPVDPYAPNDGDDDVQVPQYFVEAVDGGFILRTWEGEGPIDIGPDWVIPDDAQIMLGNIGGLAPTVPVIVKLDGTEIGRMYNSEPRGFVSAGHFTFFKSLTYDGSSIVIELTSCWEIMIATVADVNVVVTDPSGQELIPFDAPGDFSYPLFIDVDETSEEPDVWMTLIFDRQPGAVSITPVEYTLTDIYGVDPEDLNPTGENIIDYRQLDEIGFVWLAIDGYPGIVPDDDGAGEGGGGSSGGGSSDRNSDVTGFVNRFYDVVLGRSADPEGLSYWTSSLIYGSRTGADVARGFILSNEFTGKELSDSEFLTILYRAFFNRTPDDAGFDSWMAALEGGSTREQVLNGFINSPEFAELCRSFGIRSGATGSDPVAACRALLTQNMDNDTFINKAYRILLGRQPDETGYNYWTLRLMQGTTREEVINSIAASPEYIG